jgi:hypothetical protein
MDSIAKVRIAIAAVATMLAAASAGRAEWKGYFDVTGIALPGLAQPDWQVRFDGQAVRFLCVAVERCPAPTAIEIKGVLRTESLPAAFARGALSPEELTRQGEINARAKGSRFLSAIPVKIGGIEGVQMTAAVGAGSKAIHFMTTWLGRGDRMLDIKITSPDLELTRRLSTEVLEPLVRQVFK